MRDGQIDYEQYGESDLLEIYGAIDRARYPRNFESLKARLREFGYEATASGNLVRVHATSPKAGADTEKSQPREKVAPSWQTKTSLVLFGIAVVIVLFGWYELEYGSGDFGPIAGFFVAMLFASIVSAFGIWLAYRGAKAEAGTTMASNVALFTAVLFAVGIGFIFFALLSFFS